MKQKNNLSQHPASFRDPSGFIFSAQGVLYRQVNQVYRENYTALMESGLYEKLVKSGLLLPHAEVDVPAADPGPAYKVIQPESVAFVSYPYEWPFGLLKAAALATLSIQKRALKQGLWLKDASAYNIQLVRGKVTLIDTLSFEKYPEGQPWVAYRQFCQHFLAPLALMAHTDIRLGQLLQVHLDGIPLDLASRLLPWHTRLDGGLLVHIHLHAQAQQKFANSSTAPLKSTSRMPKESLIGLVESLESTVKKLQWKPEGTEWGNYYEMTNYTEDSALKKRELVSAWVNKVAPTVVWDMGANDGSFSRLASEKGIFTVSFDIDPAAVEKNYRQVVANKEKDLLPLRLDLTNPSPAIGWHNRERNSVFERAQAGMVFALALIHHLAISNNVPFLLLAGFFADLGPWLVIEFVPKSDSQVQKLLQSRADIFPEYTQEKFEEVFASRYEIAEKVRVGESERTLYLLHRK